MNDSSKMSKIELIQELSRIKVVSETEVRTKIAIPLFKQLGYADKYRAEAWPIYYNEGSTAMRPKEADIMLFDSADFDKYRNKDGVNWVHSHSLVVVELKKPTESVSAENQARFYINWTKAPFYVLTNGKELLVYRVETSSQDELMLSTTLSELPQKWAELTRILSYKAVVRYKEKNKLSSEALRTTDFSRYSTAIKQHLERQLAQPLGRTLSSTRNGGSSNFSFPTRLSGQVAGEQLKSVPATSILTPPKSVVVMAELGGGKSYLLQLLASELLKAEGGNRPNASAGPIPIMLEAKLWQRGPFNSLVSGIWAELKDYIPGLTEEIVEDDLKNGRFTILVDGLDEVTQSPDTLYKELITHARQNTFQIIATCRPENYHGELAGTFDSCEIDLLSTEQVQKYVRNVLDKKAYSFLEQLNPSLQELMHRPLFLQMTTQLAGDLPKLKLLQNRASLYKLYTQQVLTERPYSRSPSLGEVAHGIKERILAEYAQPQFRKSGDDFALNQIIQQLATFHDPKAIRKELLGSGLLRDEGRGPSFFHPSFQEYYYALGMSYKSDQELLNFISAHHANERFGEIFIFLAGLLEEADRQAILLDFLEEHNLYLFGRCLIARFIRDEQLHQQWSEELKKEYLTQFRRSYLRLVESHFEQIKPRLVPWRNNPLGSEHTKLAVEGNIDPDGPKIFYQLKLVPENTPDEECVNVTAKMLRGLLMQGPGGQTFPVPADVFTVSTGQAYYNLPFRDWGIDSAREIAFDRIKEELERFLKEVNFYPAHFLPLRFEHANAILRDLANFLSQTPNQLPKELKHLSLYQPLEQLIENLTNHKSVIEPLLASGWAWPSLNEIIEILEYLKTNLERYDQPAEFYLLTPPDKTSATTKQPLWEQWSDEKVIERISKFYWFFQLSYGVVVEQFFPTLQPYLAFYSYSPLRFHCTIVKPKNKNTEPTVLVHWEGVAEGADATPLVEIVSEGAANLQKPKISDILAQVHQLGRKPIFEPPYPRQSHAISYYLSDRPVILTKIYEQLQEDFKAFFKKLSP
jgi:hypothetical protein